MCYCKTNNVPSQSFLQIHALQDKMLIIVRASAYFLEESALRFQALPHSLHRSAALHALLWKLRSKSSCCDLLFGRSNKSYASSAPTDGEPCSMWGTDSSDHGLITWMCLTPNSRVLRTVLSVARMSTPEALAYRTS